MTDQVPGDEGSTPVANDDGRPLSTVQRFQMPHLLRVGPHRLVWAGFLLINGFVTIGLLAVVARISGTPFIFPSLGPTALLLFLHPLQPAACPRNTLCGHAIGIVCGFAALWLTGLTHAATALAGGHPMERVYSAALSLALTGGLIALLDMSHPPAGATTLIVSLGIITQPYHLVVIEIAVAILVLQALVINRLAGIPYPLWSHPGRPVPEELDAAARTKPG